MQQQTVTGPLPTAEGGAATTRQMADGPESREYAVDRLVSHGCQDDGSLVYRVRWYGYAPNQDTGEPAQQLPAELVRRYHQRMERAARGREHRR